MNYNNKSLSLDDVKKFITPDNTTPITQVDLNKPTGEDPVVAITTKPVTNLDLPKPNTTPLNSEVLVAPAVTPVATGKGYGDKALSFDQVKKFITPDTSTPITAVDLNKPQGEDPVVAITTKPVTILDLPKPNTTPLNSEVLKAPDVNPNATIVTTPIKAVDLHPEVVAPVPVANIKGAEDEAKKKDEKYVSDGFGTLINAEGHHKHHHAGGSVKASGGSIGTQFAMKAGWYQWNGSAVLGLFDGKGRFNYSMHKGDKFYFYNSIIKIAGQPYGKIKNNGNDFYVHADSTLIKNSIPTTAPSNAATPSPTTTTKTGVTTPAKTVLVVDANNFYVTSVQHAGMKSMGYKATVVIDIKQVNKSGGKTYYRVTKLKGNGGWENRINSNPKLAKYWVLAGDYKLSTDQSKSLSAEGFYMDGVNGAGKVNTVYDFGHPKRKRYLKDDGTASGYYDDNSAADNTASAYSSYGDNTASGYDQQAQMQQDAAVIGQAQAGSMINQLQTSGLSPMQQQLMLQQQQLLLSMQQAASNPTALQQLQAQQAQLQQQLQQYGVTPAMQQQYTTQLQQTATTAATTASTTGQLPSGVQGQLTARNTSGTAQGDNLAAGQVVSVYGNNGEYFNNGINTQPYTLLIDTYYPVVMSDGTSQNVPLPKGSTIWADAPFDYNSIAPEHKPSFPDPADGNNQFQRYSWASVNGVTIGGGLIPMRKDTIQIDNTYNQAGQTMSDVGNPATKPADTNPSPAKPATGTSVGAYTDAAATTPAPMSMTTKVFIGVGVLAAAYGLYHYRDEIMKLFKGKK